MKEDSKGTAGRTPAIRGIDHIGIAVAALDGRLGFWTEALGLELGGTETVETEQVRVAFLDAGPSRIELLEATESSSPIARFVERRGEGIHHLTLAVVDLDASLQQLTDHGVTILGDGARPGAGGSRVAFIHPRDTGGVLVELVERPGQGRRAVAGRIAPGEVVLAYLRDPVEKLWGVLRERDVAGVTLEGIDLGSFDDWVAQLERGEESVVGPSLMFVPMSRVEKLLLDRSSGSLPSLAERFHRRIGRSVQQVVSPGED